MTPKERPLPRWGQWAAGGVMLAASLTAGGTGLVLNVSHGLETGLAAGITYGLADLGKIIIPVVAAAIGWSRHLRLTAAVCVAVSLWCATNYYLDRNGAALLARQDQAATRSDAKGDAARIRGELAAISETGSAEALRQAAKLASDRAEAEETNGGCRKRCLDAKAEAAKLIERAGQAEPRAELEGRLEKAKADAQASGGPPETSGMASLLGAAIGSGADQIARSMGAVDAALFLLLMELLVWLNMPAAKLLGQAMAPHDDAGSDVDQPRTNDGPRRGKRASPAGPNVVPLNKPLLPMALRGMSQRQIAEATGLSKTTVQRRLAEERSAADQKRAATA